MLYEYQKSAESPSLETIAATRSGCTQLGIGFSQALRVLKRMLDEGSRFANLENAVGYGAVLLLCHKGSDALWVFYAMSLKAAG